MRIGWRGKVREFVYVILEASLGRKIVSGGKESAVPAPIYRIQVTPCSSLLDFGETQQLTATLFSVSGAILTGRKVTWSSSDDSIVSVDSNGLVSVRGGGAVTITAIAEGISGTAHVAATVPDPLTLTLDFNPLKRRSDLADPLIMVSDTDRTGYQEAVPQHIGSGLLNTPSNSVARASYPKSNSEWGFVAPVDGPMSASFIPGTHAAASASQIDGPYPNTAAITVVPSSAANHFTALDNRWTALATPDSQDGAKFKRSMACVLIAATPSDVGQSVRVNLLDNSHYPTGDWTGANVIAFLDVTLTHHLGEVDHTSGTADLWEHVAITFPDATTQAASPSPQLFISMTDPAVVVSYAVAPYMARAWQDEGDPDPYNWLRPLPFHEQLGVLSTDFYAQCWNKDSDDPTLYNPSASSSKSTSALVAPDGARYHGGRTLKQFALAVGDGITTSTPIRIEDPGGTPPAPSNVPVVSAWIHWYLEPEAGQALPNDADLAVYLLASNAETPGTPVLDSVQRANDLTHPGSADTGQAWVVVSGVWGIESNALRLEKTVDSTNDSIVIDSHASDCTVEVTLLHPGNDGAVIFRSVDVNNRWRVIWEFGTVYIQKQAAGFGYSTVVSTAVPLEDGDKIAVVLLGASIQVTHNGTAVPALSVSDPFNETATMHGIGASNNVTQVSRFVVSTTGGGIAQQYGPFPLQRDSTRYGLANGSVLVGPSGEQFYRARAQFNLAGEGYLDFTPRIVNASTEQIVFNATRVAVTTEGSRGMGLHSAWVPKRTITGRQFGDSCFEVFPNIQQFLSTATLLWGMRQNVPWSFGELNDINGAHAQSMYPSLWQSGPYGSSDYLFKCEVGHTIDAGTWYLEILVGRGTPTPNPQDFMSWSIRINDMSLATTLPAWQKFVAFDIWCAAQDGAPILFGIGLGTGTDVAWLNDGDSFLDGTVVFAQQSGAGWTFDGGNYSDSGHMGIAADLDRVRQTNGGIEAIAASNVIDDAVDNLKKRIEYHIVSQWGARRDHRLALPR